jgi:hypothetical protein
VDDAGVERLGAPLPRELARQVQVQPAGEGQHERHDVRGDVVVVDLAEVRHDHGVGDQLGVVEPRWRGRLGGL